MRERGTRLVGWVRRHDLLRVQHPDEDVRRRGRVLLVLAAGFTALGVVAAPLALLLPGGGLYTTAFTLLCVVYVVVALLARHGRVDLAVAVTMLGYAAALVLGVLAKGAVTTAPIFALCLVTLAGTLLRPRHVLLAYAGAAALVVALPALVGFRTLPVSWAEQVFVVAVASVVTTIAAATSSSAISRSLTSAREQRDRAEVLADELRRANERLESRVAERTAQLSEMAVRDPLTGVHNRRHVDTELPRLVQGVAVHRPLAVLAVDVDDFKSVNDRFGHAGGDAVLVGLAGVLRSVLRPDDVLGRVGGEEFVILLPDTGLGDAVGIADRVRRLVSQVDWSPDLDGLRLTVSVGVAATTAPTAADGVWRLADDRLFTAKREGKDRVVARDPWPAPRRAATGAPAAAGA